MRRSIFLIVILLFIVNILACSSRIKLQFHQPNKAELVGIKRLVVAPCEGDENASLLCDFLKNAIVQTDYFELYDNDGFSLALQQHQLSYENIKQGDSLGQVGKLLNVNGVIFSELMALEILPDELGVDQVEKSVWTGEYERDENGEIIEAVSPTGERTKKKKFKLQKVDQHYRIRKAKIDARFQLVDLQKSVSIMTKELKEGFISEKFIQEENQKAPSDDEIKNKLAMKVAQLFFNEIVPKKIKVKRAIESGIAIADSGVVYAKNDQWKKARAWWLQAEKVNPTDARIQYNLGLVSEALGDYKYAEMYYKKASLLNPKKKLYQKAVQNLRKRWQDK